MSTQEWLEDQELVGLAAINTIVKKLISRWMSGLHVVQLDLVSAIFDGQDILLCTATGDGKLTICCILCSLSCALGIYQIPGGVSSWPSNSDKPVGVVIMPTKGLAIL